MPKFAIMHVGFKMPTPDQMQAWKGWFQAVAPHTVQNIGFRAAREITGAGAVDLPFDETAITGLTIVEAADMAAAEKLTENNPFVTAIRVYEVMEHG